MTSPLDQVSHKLGTLDANVAILIQRADKAEKQQEAILRSLGDIKTTLKPVVSDVAFMKPHVDSYAGVRRRAVWLGGVLLTAGGTLGGMIGNYLVKKYGV